MAVEPPLTPELLARFGPLKTYPAGQRVDTSVDPDKLVKTHCCFCGQQCGIQLKVKENAVVGFEPWEDFPFNKGMLCPKGVRRYLQGSHHDRLTRALSSRSIVGRRIPGDRLRRGDPAGGVGDRADPEPVRPRRLCHPRRGEHDDREVLLARQVRPDVSQIKTY